MCPSSTRLRRLLPALLVLPLATLAQTPGVGIGTTAPNASAALDIVSTTKGALLPRLTAAQIAAIASPATGLLVFQTDGTPGFYYNTGTPAAANWQQVATATGAAVTATNGLTKTGSTIALGGTALAANTDLPLNGKTLTFSGSGLVGIGTSTPAARLHLSPATDAERGLQVGDNSSGGNVGLQALAGGNAGFGTLSFNGYYNGGEQRINTSKNRWRVGVDQRSSTDGFFIDTYNGTTQTTLLGATTGGNVGIGTATPAARLDVEGGGLLVGGSTSSLATQGAHLQWNRSGSDGETWLIDNLGSSTSGAAGIRFGGISPTGNTALREWGRFLNNGRFGLGTTTPAGTLEVYTPVALGTAAVDQQQTTGGSTTGGSTYYQSFTAGVSGQLQQLGVYLEGIVGATPTAGPGVLEVFQGVGTGGSLLASQAFTIPARPANTTQTTVTFDVPTLLAAGQVYTFRVTNSTGLTISTPLCTNNCYAGGSASALSTADFLFQTVVAPTLAPAQSALLVSAGRVGIGTTTPSQRLEVAGQVYSNTGGFRFPDNTVQTTAATTPANITASNGLTKTGNDIALGGTLTGATTIAQAGYALGLTGGNVGVGTATPAARLDVEGGGLLVGSSGSVATQGAHLQWNRSGSEGETWLLNNLGGGSTTTAGIRFGGASGGSATEWARFQNNGYLGVGSTSPSARLTVQPATDAELGLRVTNGSTSGNMVLQPLTGPNAGFSYLGFNGAYTGSEVRYNTGKYRWRVGVDQRNSADGFFIDTFNGSTLTPILGATIDGNVGVGTTNPQGRLEVSGGAVLLTNSGVGNASPRPAVGTARVGGEISAVGYAGGGNSVLAADDGFLRLSAGGGTSARRTYIDLAGYSSVPDMNLNLVLGTTSTERMRITGLGNVGIGTPNPAQSAALEVNATDKGLLVPRLTTAQRDAIAVPTNGLLIYNVDCGNFNYYNNGAWAPLNNTGGGLAAPGGISGPAAVCPGSSAAYSVAAVSGATTYLWTVPTGWNITAGQGTTQLTATPTGSSSNGLLTVAAANSCTSSALSTRTVTAVPYFSPISINGPTEICANNAELYIISTQDPDLYNDPNTSFLWQSSGGPLNISTANGGRTATITATGSFGTTSNVTVSISNPCGTSGGTPISITVGNGATVHGSAKYYYTGTMQTFTVPACGNVHQLSVDMYGGGSGPINYMGGNPGRVQCTLNVTPGQTLNLFLGGNGGYSNNGGPGSCPGGWNGGGNGSTSVSKTETTIDSNGYPNTYTYKVGAASGGGGGSDIRIGGTQLGHRKLVVGGGGGNGVYCFGGDGGGAVGGYGSGDGSANSAGGNPGTGTYGGSYNGISGFGGDANAEGTNGGGGGGGFWGGGNGYHKGGGGGSGAADGSLTSNVVYSVGNPHFAGQLTLTW